MWWGSAASPRDDDPPVGEQAETTAGGVPAAASSSTPRRPMTETEATEWLRQLLLLQPGPRHSTNDDEENDDGRRGGGAGVEASSGRSSRRLRQRRKRVQFVQKADDAMRICTDMDLCRQVLMEALLFGWDDDNEDNDNDDRPSSSIPDSDVLPNVVALNDSTNDVDGGHNLWQEDSAASQVSLWEYLLLLHPGRHRTTNSRTTASTGSTSHCHHTVATSADLQFVRTQSLRRWKQEWDDACHGTGGGGGRRPRQCRQWMHQWPERLQSHYRRLDEFRRSGRSDGGTTTTAPHPSSAHDAKRRRLDLILRGRVQHDDNGDDESPATTTSLDDDRWIVALSYLVCHWSVVVAAATVEATMSEDDEGVKSDGTNDRHPLDRPWEGPLGDIVVRMHAMCFPKKFTRDDASSSFDANATTEAAAADSTNPSHHPAKRRRVGIRDLDDVDESAVWWTTELRAVSDWYLLDHSTVLQDEHCRLQQSKSWTVNHWMRGSWVDVLSHRLGWSTFTTQAFVVEKLVRIHRRCLRDAQDDCNQEQAVEKRSFASQIASMMWTVLPSGSRFAVPVATADVARHVSDQLRRAQDLRSSRTRPRDDDEGIDHDSPERRALIEFVQHDMLYPYRVLMDAYLLQSMSHMAIELSRKLDHPICWYKMWMHSLMRGELFRKQPPSKAFVATVVPLLTKRGVAVFYCLFNDFAHLCKSPATRHKISDDERNYLESSCHLCMSALPQLSSEMVDLIFGAVTAVLAIHRPDLPTSDDLVLRSLSGSKHNHNAFAAARPSWRRNVGGPVHGAASVDVPSSLWTTRKDDGQRVPNLQHVWDCLRGGIQAPSLTAPQVRPGAQQKTPEVATAAAAAAEPLVGEVQATAHPSEGAVEATSATPPPPPRESPPAKSPSSPPQEPDTPVALEASLPSPMRRDDSAAEASGSEEEESEEDVEAEELEEVEEEEDDEVPPAAAPQEVIDLIDSTTDEGAADDRSDEDVDDFREDHDSNSDEVENIASSTEEEAIEEVDDDDDDDDDEEEVDVNDDNGARMGSPQYDDEESSNGSVQEEPQSPDVSIPPAGPSPGHSKLAPSENQDDESSHEDVDDDRQSYYDDASPTIMQRAYNSTEDGYLAEDSQGHSDEEDDRRASAPPTPAIPTLKEVGPMIALGDQISTTRSTAAVRSGADSTAPSPLVELMDPGYDAEDSQRSEDEGPPARKRQSETGYEAGDSQGQTEGEEDEAALSEDERHPTHPTASEQEAAQSTSEGLSAASLAVSPLAVKQRTFSDMSAADEATYGDHMESSEIEEAGLEPSPMPQQEQAVSPSPGQSRSLYDYALSAQSNVPESSTVRLADAASQAESDAAVAVTERSQAASILSADNDFEEAMAFDDDAFMIDHVPEELRDSFSGEKSKASRQEGDSLGHVDQTIANASGTGGGSGDQATRDGALSLLELTTAENPATVKISVGSEFPAQKDFPGVPEKATKNDMLEPTQEDDEADSQVHGLPVESAPAEEATPEDDKNDSKALGLSAKNVDSGTAPADEEILEEDMTDSTAQSQPTRSVDSDAAPADEGIPEDDEDGPKAHGLSSENVESETAHTDVAILDEGEAGSKVHGLPAENVGSDSAHAEEGVPEVDVADARAHGLSSVDTGADISDTDDEPITERDKDDTAAHAPSAEPAVAVANDAGADDSKAEDDSKPHGLPTGLVGAHIAYESNAEDGEDDSKMPAIQAKNVGNDSEPGADKSIAEDAQGDKEAYGLASKNAGIDEDVKDESKADSVKDDTVAVSLPTDNAGIDGTLAEEAESKAGDGQDGSEERGQLDLETDAPPSASTRRQSSRRANEAAVIDPAATSRTQLLRSSAGSNAGYSSDVFFALTGSRPPTSAPDINEQGVITAGASESEAGFIEAAPFEGEQVGTSNAAAAVHVPEQPLRRSARRRTPASLSRQVDESSAARPQPEPASTTEAPSSGVAASGRRTSARIARVQPEPSSTTETPSSEFAASGKRTSARIKGAPPEPASTTETPSSGVAASGKRASARIAGAPPEPASTTETPSSGVAASGKRASARIKGAPPDPASTTKTPSSGVAASGKRTSARIKGAPPEPAPTAETPSSGVAASGQQASARSAAATLPRAPRSSARSGRSNPTPAAIPPPVEPRRTSARRGEGVPPAAGGTASRTPAATSSLSTDDGAAGVGSGRVAASSSVATSATPASRTTKRTPTVASAAPPPPPQPPTRRSDRLRTNPAHPTPPAASTTPAAASTSTTAAAAASTTASSTSTPTTRRTAPHTPFSVFTPSSPSGRLPSEGVSGRTRSQGPPAHSTRSHDKHPAGS